MIQHIRKHMTGKTILILFICFAIPSIVVGNFIRFDDAKLNGNLTYYSYHIHVYFAHKNVQQRNEAITLRNRFLSVFNTSDCHDPCDTWCPRICHWNLNLSPVGYDWTNLLVEKHYFIVNFRPHTTGSWGIYIPLEQFPRAVSFISMYHGNLSVLVHPNSGHPKIDHLLNALWIKSILPLNSNSIWRSFFSRSTLFAILVENQLSDNAPLPSHRIFN